MTDTPYHEWTSCEFYGHVYYVTGGSPVRTCVCCGDTYTSDTDQTFCEAFSHREAFSHNFINGECQNCGVLA